MRTHDVRVGETYLVEVPHRLPESRYPIPIADTERFAEWWHLQRLRGGRFRLVVTAVDTDQAPPVVEGIRVVHAAWVHLDLTIEQTLQLGLPPGVYFVAGTLHDVNGDLVRLPNVETLRIPVRWLYPEDASRPHTHRDLDTFD